MCCIWSMPTLFFIIDERFVHHWRARKIPFKTHSEKYLFRFYEDNTTQVNNSFWCDFHRSACNSSACTLVTYCCIIVIKLHFVVTDADVNVFLFLLTTWSSKWHHVYHFIQRGIEFPCHMYMEILLENYLQNDDPASVDEVCPPSCSYLMNGLYTIKEPGKFPSTCIQKNVHSVSIKITHGRWIITFSVIFTNHPIVALRAVSLPTAVYYLLKYILECLILTKLF